MARLAYFVLGFLVFGCGGSSSGDSGDDTGRIGGGGSGGDAAGSRAGMGGTDDDTSGGDGGEGTAAGSGGMVGTPSAAQELSRDPEGHCATACARSVECVPQGTSTLAECEARCTEDVIVAAESEECAELMLTALRCIDGAECTNLNAACDRQFEEAQRCAGVGGRTCSSGQLEPAGTPSPGDVACTQSCEANRTTPLQETECRYAETGFDCACTEDGVAMPDVMAESCEAAFDLCFP